MTQLELLLEALQDIAGYVLPFYTVNGKQYVPLANADYLRTRAKEALSADVSRGTSPNSQTSEKP